MTTTVGRVRYRLWPGTRRRGDCAQVHRCRCRYVRRSDRYEVVSFRPPLEGSAGSSRGPGLLASRWLVYLTSADLAHRRRLRRRVRRLGRQTSPACVRCSASCGRCGSRSSCGGRLAWVSVGCSSRPATSSTSPRPSTWTRCPYPSVADIGYPRCLPILVAATVPTRHRAEVGRRRSGVARRARRGARSRRRSAARGRAHDRRRLSVVGSRWSSARRTLFVTAAESMIVGVLTLLEAAQPQWLLLAAGLGGLRPCGDITYLLR